MDRTGKWIVERRKELGLTQQQVADVVGVKARTVQYWENEGRPPRLNLVQLLRLCRVLNCSLEQLARDFYPHEFEGEENPKK